MKKKIILTVSCFILFFIANATHNQGGEITVEQIGTLQYQAYIHTYTKASSLPADRDSLQICWGDGICEWIARDTSYIVGEDLKYNRYPHVHTYFTQGTYTLSLTDPNRNTGIINLNPPLSDNIPFHIETTIIVNNLQNSTPVITNPITDLAYIGEIYQHNPVAFDWEGDSLVYEFLVPQQGVNTPVTNYFFPDQIMPGQNNNLDIHPEYGTITWNAPQMEGLYTIAIKISEYRGNNLLSTTIRDFQITVEDGFNLSPNIMVTNLIADEVTLSVGDTLNFDIQGVDPSSEEIWLQALGQPFQLNNPPIFGAPSDFINATIFADFNWEITDDHVLFSPHYIIFRLEERGANSVGGLTKYKVIKVSVNDSPTSITNIRNELDFSVFPNPVTEGKLNFKFNDEFLGEKAQVEILSLDGKLLFEKTMNVSQSQQSIDIPKFSSANYILTIKNSIQTGSTIITVKHE